MAEDKKAPYLAPELEALAKSLIKSPEWHANRRHGIGGSDTNVIMGGDQDKIHKLWELKTGRTEPENLNHILPVVMGQVTEDLNLLFLQQALNLPIYDTQASITDKTRPWLRASLDGMVDLPEGRAVVEAKHTNAYSNQKKINQTYMPQFQHNMRVAEVELAVVTVFFGNMNHEHWVVKRSLGYQSEMLERLEEFWDCVERDQPPAGGKTIAIPKQSERDVSYDMSTDNMWGNAATDWLENKEAATKFEASKKELKEKLLSVADAEEMTGHGVKAKVSKSGSVNIRKA